MNTIERMVPPLQVEIYVGGLVRQADAWLAWLLIPPKGWQCVAGGRTRGEAEGALTSLYPGTLFPAKVLKRGCVPQAGASHE